MRPEGIAVVHIKGHQKGILVEIEGNNLADRQAKQAALEKEEARMRNRKISQSSMKKSRRNSKNGEGKKMKKANGYYRMGNRS